MTNDPLWGMTPSDEGWWAEVADAAESLAVAIHQDDTARRDRKAAALADALRRTTEGEEEDRPDWSYGSW